MKIPLNFSSNRVRIPLIIGILFLFVSGLVLFNNKYDRKNDYIVNQDSFDPNTEYDNNDASINEPSEENLEILPKPILNKSSGNNGPIPNDILVNFSCMGVAGTKCKVILTNTNNSKTITLEEQLLDDSNRGQPAAHWTWRSVTGTWKITAQLSNAGQESSQSDAQELVVE